MALIGDYTSDLGRTFWAVSLSFTFVSIRGDNFTPVELAPPATWLGHVRDVDQIPCSLLLKPRELWLYLESGDYWRLVNPFQPASLQYFAILAELSLNPSVVKVEPKPEVIKPYALRQLLNAGT